MSDLMGRWPSGYLPPSGKTSAMWARCGDDANCGHVWPVAFLPMELEIAAHLGRIARCPACGGAGEKAKITDAPTGGPL